MKVLVDKDFLEDGLELICDSIRLKTGGTGVLAFPVEIKTAVDSIETGSGGITPTGTKEITENGTYDVTTFASAEVTVPGGVPAAMDGGRTTADGYVAVKSADGRSLVINDAGFDGSDAVGCFVKIRYQRSGTTIIQGVLVIPTGHTQTEPYRIFDMHLDAAGNLTITSNFLSAGAGGFETGEHFLSLTLPSNVTEDFFAGTDSYGEYFVYPIRGTGRSV